jgi:hypothetical protein
MASVKAEAKYAAVPEDEHSAQEMAAVAVALSNENALSSSKQASSVKQGDATLEVDGQPWSQGVRQELAFHDKWFAVAFLLHLIAVIGAAIALGNNWSISLAAGSSDRSLEAVPQESGEFVMSSGEESTEDDPPMLMIVATLAVSAITAPVLSIMALGVMATNASRLLEFLLIFAVALNVILMVLAIVINAIAAIIVHGIFAVILACYARSAWHRIPYAAANLKAAVQAVQWNLGVMLVALSSMVVFCVWIVTWTVAFGGAVLQPDLMTKEATEEHCYDDCTCVEPGDTEITGVGFILYIGFLLSFYWTHQVIQNSVRCTVAGTVGTFWFIPMDASSVCSRGVTDSLVQSTTYSLGSICFGSLIVAILQVMRTLLRSTANNRRAGVLRCIAQCILLYIERIAEYFNKWAFIYVGLYGYGYLDAGKAIIGLFKARGWSTITSDNLVNRLLGIVILIIGLLTGVASILTSIIFEVADKANGWLVLGFL